jgi:hypothetical protein
MIGTRTVTIRNAADRNDAIRRTKAYLAAQPQHIEVTNVISVVAPFGSLNQTDWQVEVQTKTAGPWKAPATKWGRIGEDR